jgi:hypothetical protein
MVTFSESEARYLIEKSGFCQRTSFVAPARIRPNGSAFKSPLSFIKIDPTFPVLSISAFSEERTKKRTILILQKSKKRDLD